jgi:hypothetical protein
VQEPVEHAFFMKSAVVAPFTTVQESDKETPSACVALASKLLVLGVYMHP